MSIFSVINITSSTGQNVPIAQAVSSSYNYTVYGSLGSFPVQYQITLCNNQSIPTTPNFQQLLVLNLTQLNISILGGIRFFSYNSTPLYAWLESYNNNTGIAYIWVNLGNEIIPAQNYNTIILGYNNSYNFDDIYWGEAPQLSLSYGQYDNGINVFNYYWNFSGTSLPNGLQAYNNGGTATFNVNNGLTLTPSSANGVYAVVTAFNITPPIVADFYGYIGAKTSSSYSGQGFGFGMGIQGQDLGEYAQEGWKAISSASTYIIFGTTSSISTNQGTIMSVWTTMYGSTGYGMLNYGSTTSGTGGTTAYNLGIGTQNNVNPTYIQWLRIRNYPPNGVMPAVSNISGPSSNILQSSNNYAVIPVGSQINISIYPVVNVTWYVNNAVVSTNTTYYTTTFNQAGIYSIYASNSYLISSYLNITVYDPKNIVTLEQCYIDPNNMVYSSGQYGYSIMFDLPVPNWVTAIQVGLTSTSTSGSKYNPITVGWILQKYVNNQFINVTSLMPVTVQNPANYTFPINLQLPYDPGSLYDIYALSFYPLSNSTSDIQNITFLGIASSTSYLIDNNYYAFQYINATGSAIQNANTYIMSMVFQQSLNFGNLTIIESGLPSGTSWSVTLTNNGNVFTSTTNSILIQLPYNATFTFTVSSSNSLYTPSPASFTVNTSLFNLSPSITKSITFNYAIPSPYVQITEYPDDAGNLDPYNISVIVLYNPNNLPPDILTPSYLNITFDVNGSGSAYPISMSWNWSAYTLYLYNISGPTSSSASEQPVSGVNGLTVSLNMIGPSGKSVKILGGSFSYPVTSNEYINFMFIGQYTITFVPNGLYPNAGTWSVTLTSTTGTILSGGSSTSITLSTQNNGTIVFGAFNGSYSYTVTPPQYYYASVNGSGTISVSGANVTVNITFSPVLYTVQTWVSGFMPGETIWINVTGTTIYGFQYSNSSTFVTTNYYSSWGTNLSLYAGLYNFTFAYTQIYQNYTNITASYWFAGSQFTFNNVTLQGSFYLTGSGGISFMVQIIEYNVTIITNLPNSYQIMQYSFTNMNSTLAGIPAYNPSGLAGNTVTVQVPKGIYQIFIEINTNEYSNVPVSSFNTTMVVNIYQDTVIYYNFTYKMINYTLNIIINPLFIQPFQYTVYLNGTEYNGTVLNYSFSGTITSQIYQINMNLLPGYFNGIFIQNSQIYTPNSTAFTISYQNVWIDLYLQVYYVPVIFQISGFVQQYNIYIYIQNQTNPIMNLFNCSSTQVIELAPFVTYNYTGTDYGNPQDYTNGSFYISSPNQTVYIVFLPEYYANVYIIETGLPTNVQWSATIYVTYWTGTKNNIAETNSSSTNVIGFSVPYGSSFTIYIQNVSYINTYVPTPNVLEGAVSAIGNAVYLTNNGSSNIGPFQVTFSIYTPPSQPPTGSGSYTGGSSYIPSINQTLSYVNQTLSYVLPFSVSVFWLVVYVLFIIGIIGYVAYKTGNTMATIITGGALVSIGYVMGIIPGWIIAFLFAIAIATLLYVMFLRGSESE
ncbi:MAG: DUF2341 domain-containing protein [Candidatus Micrarchaeaceae archaeon]